MARLLRLIILGPPGAGKGTISKRIVTDFQLTHLASGDILRSHVARETEIGRVVKDFLVKGMWARVCVCVCYATENGDVCSLLYSFPGQLVPDHVILKLMLNELLSLSGCGWLLDGFPRTALQAQSLSEQHDVSAVINLNVPFDTIISRVKERWVHLASGRVYNLSYNPPQVAGKDDLTGTLRGEQIMHI